MTKTRLARHDHPSPPASELGSSEIDLWRVVPTAMVADLMLGDDAGLIGGEI